MNAHDHDHGGHDHHHGGHHHHRGPVALGDRRYLIAIGLSLTIVAVETIGGFLANSTALVADAGHVLSDVLGLALAGGATWLAARPARGRRTYGFGKATVLAALANGVVLIFVSGGIALEAVNRLMRPEGVGSLLVMATAGVGVVVNSITALMFSRGRERDLNVRGVFLHMAGDAGISLGVIAAAVAILLTGWTWIDPVVSLAIVAFIVWGTWGLLREAADLALDAAPADADLESIHDFLSRSAGVTEVHDLHLWAMSTTEMALTAHLVRPEHDGGDAFRADLAEELEHRFGVRHATLQIEQARGEHCPVC
ncbi:MAG TPA: cation diffusion facilitator family transporter [Caulobacteraceae bacterium]|nr:cation diffusion facilitator family transporter [Caulobacteraceae bacterium]